MIDRRLLRRRMLSNIEKYNPHHDQRGRFSSGGGGSKSFALSSETGGPPKHKDAKVNTAMQQAWDRAERHGFPDKLDPRNGAPHYAAESARIDTITKQLRDEGMSTEQLYGNGKGGFSAERQKQQNALADEIFGEFVKNGAAKDGVALWMGGPPGSGKTHLLHSSEFKDALGVDPKKYVIHDPDAIKVRMADSGMLPTEKWKGLKAHEATDLYHMESCIIADMVMKKAARQGYNVVFDGTMKTAPNVAKQMETMKGRGYETRISFLNVSPEVALASAKNRFLSGQRYVSPSITLKAALPGRSGKSPPEETFATLKGVADRYAEFGRAAPRAEAVMEHGFTDPRGGRQRAPAEAEPQMLGFTLLTISPLLKRRGRLTKVDTNSTEITRWIMAYRASVMSWDELYMALVNHTYKPSAQPVDYYDEESADHFPPGTFEEVTGAWIEGLLTDDEYEKIANGYAKS